MFGVHSVRFKTFTISLPGEQGIPCKGVRTLTEKWLVCFPAAFVIIPDVEDGSRTARDKPSMFCVCPGTICEGERTFDAIKTFTVCEGGPLRAVHLPQVAGGMSQLGFCCPFSFASKRRGDALQGCKDFNREMAGLLSCSFCNHP